MCYATLMATRIDASATFAMATDNLRMNYDEVSALAGGKLSKIGVFVRVFLLFWVCNSLNWVRIVRM